MWLWHCFAHSRLGKEQDKMYRIDEEKNRIMPLTKATFTELGYAERANLQEWIANQPDVLGEPLLVIQKEFAGWENSNERLDLLAIDKFGSLVVIENKLDSSGRDVVWQAIKYASYCSTLPKATIARIYQQYLDVESPGANAKERISEFLDARDFEELELNVGSSQRIIMIAAEFRVEVTSAVLWLLKHKLSVQCFKATPFEHGSDRFLSLHQVIPLPEAEEMMVRIAEKEEQEAEDRGPRGARQMYRELWTQVLTSLQSAGVQVFSGRKTPSNDQWINTSVGGLSGVHYCLKITKRQAVVMLGIERDRDEESKQLFDHLHARSRELNERFGSELAWDRRDGKKWCHIQFAERFDSYNRECWPAMIAWFIQNIQRLEATFSPEFPAMRQKLLQWR